MSFDIHEAKRKLPLPDLLARLGLGDHAKKSARCPWPSNHKHGDRNPSFGIFQEGDGWGWKCFVCGGGDEITFLERHEGLANGDAIRRFCELAGVNGSSPGAAASSPPVVKPKAEGCIALPEPDAGFVEGLAKRLAVNPETIRKLVVEDALGFEKARGAIAFACQNTDGSIAALHLRGKKTDGSRWFAWTPEGCTAGLWRLPAVTRADKLIVVEGETDGIAVLDTGIEAEGFGVVAKTGAGSFPDDALPVFRGKTVFVIPDNDKAGRDGAEKTAAKLAGVAEVHVVALPEMPEGKKDLRDWVGLGNGKAELRALLDKAKLPAVEVLTEPTKPVSFGLPKRFCYDLGGWIADYFAVFEPRTEPSYAFHLAGALAAMDTILGRRVYWQFGNTTLYAQDYYLLAGSVAAARKSTALACAARVIRCLETDAMPYRMADGFSYESMPDEFAEWSLRLWLLDEFSSLLVQQQKDYGKGIAQTLNSMWAGVDRIRLRFRGRDKDKAAVIENPTLTILAATSLELLQANLRAGDQGGFTSRLLPFYAEGDSKDLPEPLPIARDEVVALANELKRLCEGVSGAARWTPDAAALWAEWYCQEKRNAAANPSGFSSRKPDHVRKLALKLQVSKDGGLEISDTTLAAAITIADKADESWRKVFGGETGTGGLVARLAGEALDWLRANTSVEGVPVWRFNKLLKLDAAMSEKVLKTLEVWEEVHIETRRTGGPPQRLIWPRKDRPATGNKKLVWKTHQIRKENAWSGKLISRFHDTSRRRNTMSETTSLARIEANRANARKSTGPKTEQGKAMAKFNALKHGLLAQEVVLAEGTMKESQQKFAALLESLRQDLAPTGPLEEMLVERVAVCYWRLRRVLTAEGGEINLKNVEWGRWYLDKAESFAKMRDAGYHNESVFLQTAAGCKYLADELKWLRNDVEKHGELTCAAFNRMKETIGEGRTIEALAVFLMMLSDNPEKLAPDALRAKHKRIVLEFLGSRQNVVRVTLDAREEDEDAEESARVRAAILPSEEAMERLVRYEAHLERQLYRALNQLERLQRQRRGEAVPPPLSVEVGTTG